MPVFKEKAGKLKRLKALNIDKEKQLQTLVEDNLYEALELHLLATEYPTTFGGRIDTLAVDDNGAPVIIEYKRNQNDNVINQGLSYLKWLQAQKVEFFEMLMQKKLKHEIVKEIKVDWQRPRVICIAESYNKFDIDTVEVVPIRIELFRYRFYEEGVFSLEPLTVSEQTSKKESNIPLKPTTDMTVEEHLKKAVQPIKELFAKLRERIFELDENITERATAIYIAYRMSKTFAEVHVKKNQLKIYLRPVDYKDSKGMVEKVPDSYKWVTNRRVSVKDAGELDYVMTLVKQSYKDVL